MMIVQRQHLTADLGSSTVDIPVIRITGAPGPRVVFTAGVHGGEFVGIATACRLAESLSDQEIRGEVVICPVANPPAAYGGRDAESPLDGVNLNRVFPGDPAGSPTERLAAWLFANLLDGADAYVDLHSGGIEQTLTDFAGYRPTGDDDLDKRARAMAHAVGYPHVIAGLDAAGGNSHAAAARQGIPAVLIETGQLGDRGPAEHLLTGLYRLLAHLDVLDTPVEPAAPATEWVWADWISSPAAGLWHPERGTGDDVTTGQLIGRVVEPGTGQVHPVTAPAAGRIFYALHGLTTAADGELAAIAASPAHQEA